MTFEKIGELRTMLDSRGIPHEDGDHIDKHGVWESETRWQSCGAEFEAIDNGDGISLSCWSMKVEPEVALLFSLGAFKVTGGGRP